MAECQICKRSQASLKFKTDHINICAECVTVLNEWSQPAYPAQERIGDLLRKGMARRNPNYTEEQYRRARPGWFNRLLANKRNNSLDYRVVRAARRGLLRETGVTPWEYPFDWRDRAKRIRVRDGCRCQACGASDTVLDVHHIIYLSNWGTNQQNNLITLCRSCHMAEHDRYFDFGEPDEPGNPQPIRPRPGQTAKAREPRKPEPLEPIDPPYLNELASHGSRAKESSAPARHTRRPPSPPLKQQPLATLQALPPIDLWCPGCSISLTAKLTTAILESQKVRCPTCKLIFTASEGLEKRLIKMPRAPAPPPAQSTRSPASVREMHAEDDSTSATTSMRFEQSPSSAPKVDRVLRGDQAIVAIICFCFVVLAFAYGSRDTQPLPAPTLPAEEKSVDLQVQEMMSEAIHAYPYLNTDQGVEATREIIAIRNQLLDQGVLPLPALRMSIEQVAPKHDPRQVQRDDF